MGARRAAYESEVIGTFARIVRPGMSDDERNRAEKLRSNLLVSLSDVHDAINALNECGVSKINTDAFMDFIHDEIPSDKVWEEAISAKHRGY